MEADGRATIWVTGATGFVGGALVRTLLERGHHVVGVTRRLSDRLDQMERLDWLALGQAHESADPAVLKNVDCVVHLAGRAHVFRETAKVPEEAFLQANRDLTRTLARAAADAGVRRFLLLSSIGVLGHSSADHAFTATSPWAPHNAYSRSKLAAEQALSEVCDSTSLEGVVVRAPLVYGAQVPGNFLSLLRWVDRGVPLPLGAIHNRRSLVGIDNLVDLLICCLHHPAAANQTFLVSDDEDLSTSDLLRRVGVALGKPARLLPVPAGLLRIAALALGKGAVARQLLDNLEVDSSRTREVLGWTPAVTVNEGLRKTSAWYLGS